MVGKKFAILGALLLVVSSYSVGNSFVKNVGDNECDAEHDLANLVQETKIFGSDNDDMFDRIMLKLMEIAHMSALSAAVIENNGVTWAKGYGLYDRERNKEADEDTIYIVASISKTFTATAIMQLYEKGYFSLDDDVNGYLPFSLRNPNYPSEPITFRMLLAHHSSLAVDPPGFYTFIPGDLEVIGYPYPWLEDYLTPEGTLYIPYVWSDAHPGEEMYYSNIGYGVLGYLVEVISGMMFEDYCRENIFEPLGMGNTSFRLSNLDVSRVAVPYGVRFGEYYPFLHYGILDYAAGGLRTNVLDLSRFLLAHMNGGVYNGARILSRDSVEEMHAVQYPSRNYAFEYGLGWQIWKKGGDTHIGHTGGLYGVATKMVFRESDKNGILFFTNKEVYNIREIVVFSLIEQLLFWKATGKFDELKKEIVEESVLANKHILRDYVPHSREEIKMYLTELCKDIFP